MNYAHRPLYSLFSPNEWIKYIVFQPNATRFTAALLSSPKMPQKNSINATTCRSVSSVAESGRQSSCDDAAVEGAEASDGQCRGDVDHSPEISPRPTNHGVRRPGDAAQSPKVQPLLTSDGAVSVSEASTAKRPSSPDENAACGHQAAAVTSDDCDEKIASPAIAVSFKNVAMVTSALKL